MIAGTPILDSSSQDSDGGHNEGYASKNHRHSRNDQEGVTLSPT